MPGIKLSIEPLQEAQLSFLNEVRNECREFLHDNREFTLKETYDWYYKENPEYYICRVNGGMVGYFRTLYDTKDSLLIGMDLHHSERGMGYAKAFYYLFFSYLAHELEKTSVYLEVLESNKRAFQLYQDLGFSVFDERGVPGRGRSFKMYRSL